MNAPTFWQRQWERSTVHRLLKWLFSWRAVRAGLLGAAGVVTLVALFYAFENWRGWRTVEREKRTLAALGEKWDWREFVPPPVPDEQNFAMTPLLRSVLDYDRSTNWGTIRWRDTNALARLQRVRLDSAANLPRQFPSFASFELDHAAPVDLKAWQDYYRGDTNFPQPVTSQSPAADVLVALSAFDTELAELAAAAAQRPFTRFPVHYEEEDKWRILLPHLFRLKGLSYVLTLRAAARLKTGQAVNALDDVKLGLRLADTPRGEPFLISFLVRLAAQTIALKGVQQGLAQRAWSDAQLADLQRTLQNTDLLADYTRAMRGERAWSVAGLDYFGGVRDAQELTAILNDFGMARGDGWQTYGWMLALIPRGWFRQQEVAVSQFHQQFTLAMVDEKVHRVNPDLMSAATNRVSKLWRVPFPMPILQFFCEIPLAALKAARTQTWIDQAVVACALERYRLAHGQLPDSLGALVPRFVENLPPDVIDGQPLRFRKTADGGYVLYSVGWNKTDDGGQIAWTEDSEPSANAAEGDWVWSLTE